MDDHKVAPRSAASEVSAFDSPGIQALIRDPGDARWTGRPGHPRPRTNKRSRDVYTSRGAIEREFGRFKHDWALPPLRVRGIERVRLHANPHDPRQLARASPAKGARYAASRAARTAGRVANANLSRR